jgi:hypothetical protein
MQSVALYEKGVKSYYLLIKMILICFSNLNHLFINLFDC